MKVATGSDHAGFQLKATIGEYLISLGHEVVDVGAYDETPSDYPDFAEKVGRAVLDGKAERGVLICGSGVGASVAANKLRAFARACATTPIPRIKAWSTTIAMFWCWAERVIGVALAKDLVTSFLGAKFTNEERHVRRLGKVAKLEDKFCDS